VKASWKIGRFAGIDVRIHATFLILLAWVALSHWFSDKSVPSVVSGLLFILGLFACVVLHEFGHALTARRYGIQTRDIVLLPIGGVARLERMPEKPQGELQVAIAGPLVNVAIAILLWLALTFTGGWQPLGRVNIASGSLIERLLIANVSLAVFNLIPAFPMDGGRILRALLSTRMDRIRATHTAAAIGQGLAFVFGFIGLFTNPFLVFIALFVWIGAAQEASATEMQSAMSGAFVRDAMLTDYAALERSGSLDDAAHLILKGSQQDFPVVDRGRLVGVLTRSDLLRGLAQYGRDYPVVSVMQHEFVTAEDSEPLETALRKLQECKCQTMPVMHDGRLVGLLTMENITEYFLIQRALNGAGAP
jgi:Zn-dependent protease/CBS domain-containing protein